MSLILAGVRHKIIMSMSSPYVILLSEAEQNILSARARSERAEHRDRLGALIVLAAAGGEPTWVIAQRLGCVRAYGANLSRPRRRPVRWCTSPDEAPNQVRFSQWHPRGYEWASLPLRRKQAVEYRALERGACHDFCVSRR
ncbi:hypothetical protein GCM10009765_84050 [Fodinicola feengrottensis]|uniref:Helix-turn-helix domain-containing protein n=1 Tax=Fodinicola feengrottensis TaxID=435914 RepID=A0ABP4VI55_9ACTN